MVREYEAFNDRVLITESRFGQWATRMTSQYDYALVHLKQMVKNNDGTDGAEYSGMNLGVDLFYGAIVIAAYVAGYYYFEPFKNADGMNGGDKFKFEIKRAHDIE